MALAQAIPECLYAVTAEGNRLYRVGVGPGGSELVGDIGPIAPDAGVNRLTIAGPNLAYTIDTQNEILHGIRLSDARVVSSAPLDQPLWISSRALAVAPDGVLWGVLPGAQLRTIDPSTGATMLIGPITGATYIEGMAFAPDGTLYAVGNVDSRFSRKLYTIDTTTAAATLLHSLAVSDIDCLAWGYDGFVYGADADGREADLFRIDPATGAVTVPGNTGIVGVDGMAASIVCSCPADLDGDGALTLFDFLAFGVLFDLRSPLVDFDGDGDFTIFDFLAFQNAFDAGCP
jgi:hypothetical protein